MFTKSGEIGTTGLKAAKLFEKELCESMKQTFISDFFEKKWLFDTEILYWILYILIFLYWFEIWDVYEISKVFYWELPLTRTFAKSDFFSFPLEGPT